MSSQNCGVKSLRNAEHPTPPLSAHEVPARSELDLPPNGIAVTIVGEGPSADSVMPRDHLIDTGGTAGERKCGGLQHQETLFSFSLLLPTAPSARDTGRCTNRWRGGVCVCVAGGDAIRLCSVRGGLQEI